MYDNTSTEALWIIKMILYYKATVYNYKLIAINYKCKNNIF